MGTSSLVRAEQNSFNLSNIARICETVRDLYQAGVVTASLTRRACQDSLLHRLRQCMPAVQFSCCMDSQPHACCPTCNFSLIAGHRVMVVSSGAIAVGCKRLGLTTRPSNIAQRQALAAVGQVHLMRFYDDFFSALGVVSLPGFQLLAVGLYVKLLGARGD